MVNLVTNSNLAALQEQTIPRALPTSLTLLGHTPLHWAALSESPHVLTFLLSHATHADPQATAADQNGQTPLHWACVSGPLANVVVLLSHGADPSIRDGKGYTAVTHAVQYGRVHVLHLLLKIAPELATDIDSQGHTPLMWAAYYDHHPALVYLLRVSGVPVDDTDHSGMTAMHRAVHSDHWMIVEALLRHGADWQIREDSGKSAIDLAAGRSLYILRQWESGWFTRERPVLERRDVRKFALVAFYYVVLVLSYWQYWPIRSLLGVRLDIFAHVCIVLSFVSHINTTFSDPGELQKGNKKSFTEYVEKCMAEGLSETRLLPSAFCFSCLTVRTPRSKHSRERDVCVRRFDHECPWVNNTVGLHTHRSLLLLAVSTAAAEICFLVAVVRAVSSAAVESSLTDAILASPALVLLSVIHTMVGLFCGTLFVMHIILVAKGKTSYEELVALRENRTTNPYDRGVWNNVISFLTCSGPGTGRPRVVLSARTVRDAVLSRGQSIDNKDGERKDLMEEV